MTQLSTPAAYRLRQARRKAWENAASFAVSQYQNAHPDFVAKYFPMQWRTIARESARQRCSRKQVWNPPYTDASGTVWRWCESTDGLRIVHENATETVNGHRCTGYYVDSYCDESIHGVVLQIGRRYFAAVSDAHTDGIRVCMTAHDCADDAARYADSLAESDAEKQRDNDSAWQAGREWQEKQEEIAGARKLALRLLKESRAPGLSDFAREQLRTRAIEQIETRAELRSEQSELLESIPREYVDAFCDASGMTREQFRQLS